MEEGRLQAAEGGGGGLQRQGEEPAGLWAAYVAGAGERLHPCQPRPDGCVRRGHRCLSHREAGAPAERGLLRVRVDLGMGGWARGSHASTGVGEGLRGVCSSLLRGYGRVLVWIFFEDG